MSRNLQVESTVINEKERWDDKHKSIAHEGVDVKPLQNICDNVYIL